MLHRCWPTSRPQPHVTKLAACNGTISVAGFCWGGSRSFEYATHRKGLKAAYVFYGSAPTDREALGRITCPVYGFYAENDARVNATLQATADAMKALGTLFILCPNPLLQY